MAKGLDMVREVGKSATPVILGAILIQTPTLLAPIPEIAHLVGGWALVVTGVLDLLKQFGIMK